MSIGSSGRIVIEIEPESKRLLYAALAQDGLTLRDWFLRNAPSYLLENASENIPAPVIGVAKPNSIHAPDYLKKMLEKTLLLIEKSRLIQICYH